MSRKHRVRPLVALVATLALVGGLPQPAFANQSVGEAPNSYTVTVYDECNELTDRVRTEATVVNTADATGQAFKLSAIFAERSDSDLDSSAGPFPVYIPDGESHTTPVGEDFSYAGESGLYPGEWTITFRTGDGFTIAATRHVSVPACGGREPPPPPDDEPNTGNRRPTGKVKLLSCRSGKAMATLVNRGVSRHTTFTVLVDPTRGRTSTQNYSLAPNTTERHAVRNIKPGMVQVRVGRRILSSATKPRRC